MRAQQAIVKLIGNVASAALLTKDEETKKQLLTAIADACSDVWLENRTVITIPSRPNF